MIDADVISLVDEVDKRRGDAAPAADTRSDEPRIKNEKDLAEYEEIFTDTDYWKKIGEEYQSPLIVTGSMLFTEIAKSGMVVEAADVHRPARAGRRYQERPRATRTMKGYSLTPKFVFIDGRTGAAALHRVVPRGGALLREPEHAGAVVLLRADGQAAAGLPEHAEHAEDPGHADPAQVGQAAGAGSRRPSCRAAPARVLAL